MIRLLLSLLRFWRPRYAHTTTAPAVAALPVGMPRDTFDRMRAVGYDTATAMWLADFDTLTCTSLTGAVG